MPSFEDNDTSPYDLKTNLQKQHQYMEK